MIATRDPAMLALLRSVERVADSDAGVLVRGETGTGKELIARALHAGSRRRDRPFVVVHGSALPGSLLEAELFGHVRGAFTGADRDRPGRLASAAGGTLFLDEIGELPLEAQAKLLRFLQFREIQRVGADAVTTVDVRVIAATHRDLGALPGFRQDLYHRLKVVELRVPPLRERRVDILPLAESFLRARWRRPGEPRLLPDARGALEAYGFPGNVRELEHLMERAALLAEGPDLDAAAVVPIAEAPPVGFWHYSAGELEAARARAVAAVERAFVAGLLARHRGHVSNAARDSGLNRTYLQKLLARHGVVRETPWAERDGQWGGHSAVA